MAESDDKVDISVQSGQRRKRDKAADKNGETEASGEALLDSEQKKISRRARVREANPVFIAAGLISPPKGIYSTKNGTFRIQLSLDGPKKRKFSRNVDNLEQAMWLYEIKMLASDKPLKVENLILEGNFDDFFLLGLCTSRADYIEKLFSNIDVLLNDNKITEDEAKEAKEAHRNMNVVDVQLIDNKITEDEAKEAHRNMSLDDVVIADDPEIFCFIGDSVVDEQLDFLIDFPDEASISETSWNENDGDKKS